MPILLFVNLNVNNGRGMTKPQIYKSWKIQKNSHKKN